MKFTALTDEQRNQFNQQGYLIVRQALDRATVDRLIEVGDRLCASDRRENRQRENNGLYDGFRTCLPLDDAYIPLLTHPSTLPLIVQLFGPNIHLVTSHLIHKHADPVGTPRTFRQPCWHRDISGTDTDLGHAHIPRMEMKCAFYFDRFKPA